MHGDMKPENMLLAEPDPAENALYPVLKLADFGRVLFLLILNSIVLGLSPWNPSNRSGRI